VSYPLRQSTASQEVPLGPFLDSTDGNTIEDGLTIANTDIRLTKHGGTTHVDKHSGGATHDANGVYYCTLDDSDTDTAGGLVINCHVAGALAVRLECVVYPAQVFDSLFGSDYLQVDAVQVEGGDATNAIRDALVDDATRIDASALNTLSGHDPGETIMGATDLGTGTGFTAIPWNAAWDAEVQSECADALTAYDPPTATELTNGLAALNDLDAAGVRSAVGMASANLDTQLAALPTDADVQTAAGAALAAYDPPTKAELDAADDAVLAAVAALNDFDPAADTVAHVTLVDTTTTNTDMVAAAPAASAVADAVWDEALAGHAGAGTAGAALSSASAPSAADVADAVWNETVADHSGVGSTGAALAAAGGSGDPWATAVPGAYGAGTAGNIVGNLNDVSSSDVQTAAAAALTAYDPPTRTEATADKDEVLAALPAEAPSAATVADAVWDEATADHAIAGSTGEAITAAGVAGDPWTAALPGDYADGTAGAILPDLQSGLTALGASSVTVTNPVADSGDVTLYQGDDYAADDGRSLTFAVADATHALGLDTATVKLKATQATWEAASVTSTDDGYTVAFEPTAAQTAALTTRQQSYELEATLASGRVVTLAIGTLTVRHDIPEVS